MSNNIATVEHIYQCFAQGDVPGILARLSDEVCFFNGADPGLASFGGEFKGKEAVVRFFTNLGTETQTTAFEPGNFRENGNMVVNDIRHGGLINASGKPFDVQVEFTWTFNDNGLVIDWKGQGDFSSINDALRSA